MSRGAENHEQFRPEVRNTEHFLLTTVVGSYPKPKWLNHANDLAEDPDSKFTQERLHKAHDNTCRIIANEHERSGLDTVIDGEMCHEEMVEYFAHRIPGYKFNSPVKVRDHNYFDKPSIIGEVKYDGPWLVDELEFTSDMASKPVRVPIVGPYTLASWSFNEHYDSEADLAYALADLVNKEIEQLVEAGAAYTRVDEPALATMPDDHAIVGECLERIIAGVPDEIHTGLHVCYGDYSRIYPELNSYPINEFDVELCNDDYEQINVFTDPEFEPNLALGAVDVHTAEIEIVKKIKESIKQGLEAAPPEKLAVSSDYGVKLLPREVACQRMEDMAKAVREVEAEFGAGEINLDTPAPQAD